jgi:type II secretory pathway predicted ATPase ExeA
MYKDFYGLTGDPFRLSPDHKFCYRYPSFAKGRAYMQYALQAAEGFVVVTGAPGMGKTTLINDLLADYGPRDYTVATLVNTMLEANEVLRSAAYEFGINVEHMDTATVLQRLKQLFVQSHTAGRPPLLVVDEAQNLSLNALEELRMLTNLQQKGKPLLQIFLVGQEELREKLQDPSLEQLRQRVTAAAHLHALDQEQVAAYMIHRLKVVGWKGLPKLKSSLLPVIDAACAGVPRRINQFCSRLLLHGAVEQKSVLDAEDAKIVFSELSEERLSPRSVQDNSAVTTEFLDAGDTTLGEVEREDQELPDDGGEARSQPKTVMPPPTVEPAPSVPPLGPLPPVALPPVDRPSVMAAADPMALTSPDDPSPPPGPPPRPAPRQRPLPQREPVMADRPPPPNAYPGLRRPSPMPWLGLLVVICIALGLGVYAWYDNNRETAQDLLGLEVDSYLQELEREQQAAPSEELVLDGIAPIERDREAASPSAVARP